MGLFGFIKDVVTGHPIEAGKELNKDIGGAVKTVDGLVKGAVDRTAQDLVASRGDPVLALTNRLSNHPELEGGAHHGHHRSWSDNDYTNNTGRLNIG